MRKKKQKLSKIPSSITTNATRKLSRDNGKKEVWVTDYSSNHEILLVGEGDFSFSCSLATSFGSASNICASSLDSYDDVVRKYSKARSNLNNLKRLGALLLYGVDATKLQIHPHLSHKRFDRIIFNFPHAGFHGKESDPYLIRKHRELVFGFFHSASHMLRADGQVHVSHKNKEPFCLWNIEELASRCFLALVQCVAFKKTKYPGYENKRGDGSRCDESFLLGKSNTFKFRFSYAAKELYAEKVNWRAVKEREPEYPQAFSNNRPVSIDRMYPQGVSQRRLSFDISHSLDHNHRQVQDHLIQSRGRTSPLDLSYYQEEHRRSQFEEASIRATQRRGLFAQEENLMSTETSRFQYQDFPLQAIHHGQDQFLECSSRDNGSLLGIYNRGMQSMFTRNSSPHSYIGASPERCIMLSQEPFVERSNRFNGVSSEIYDREGRRMLARSSVPHPYARETKERSLARQSRLITYPPHN